MVRNDAWMTIFQQFREIENSHPKFDISCKKKKRSVSTTFRKISPEKTYLSRSSVISPNGLHSNTIKPGYPPVEGPASEEIGMEKTDSEAHDPEAGTSNLRSSHMAVASLSGFNESQICQGSFSVDGLRVPTCLRMTSRNDPCAHRSSWSLRFCERKKKKKTERKKKDAEKIHQDHDTREIVGRLMCTSFNRLASSSSVRDG